MKINEVSYTSYNYQVEPIAEKLDPASLANVERCTVEDFNQLLSNGQIKSRKVVMFYFKSGSTRREIISDNADNYSSLNNLESGTEIDPKSVVFIKLRNCENRITRAITADEAAAL